MIQNIKKMLILFFTASIPLFGQSILPVEDGPVHEAFVTRDTENFDLETIPYTPPAPINERIPPQADRQAVWIPGYWAWDQKRNDFIWMSGVWRRPPPAHQWVAGTWTNFGQGWGWVPGFWSPSSPQALSYIESSPPESVNENISQPQGGDFFWSPGYWEYSERASGYAWIQGHWERLDPNWVYVAPHYTWFNNRYVFIPGYWDWRLEERGVVYSPVYIAPQIRTTIVYQPVIVVEQPILIRRLFAFYPDYLGLFLHHHRFHANFWVNFCNTPPWWGKPVRPYRQVVGQRAGARQAVNVRDYRAAPARGPQMVVDRNQRQSVGTRTAPNKVVSIQEVPPQSVRHPNGRQAVGTR